MNTPKDRIIPAYLDETPTYLDDPDSYDSFPDDWNSDADYLDELESEGELCPHCNGTTLDPDPRNCGTCPHCFGGRV